MAGQKIFTENPAPRSARGNIFQDATAAHGSGQPERGGSQLVVPHLSPVKTADSCFGRISLRPL